MLIIEIIKYVFLGLLQGVTEPIPVSSSGHLVMAQEFLGLHTDGLTFEIVVNTASLIAVLILFRKDIIDAHC
jgi:undecaprenyl-diphosphatase